jgi:hypothetical protein
MDKYGSNIAEKSIVYGTNEFRLRIWRDKISITERYCHDFSLKRFPETLQRSVWKLCYAEGLRSCRSANLNQHSLDCEHHYLKIQIVNLWYIINLF